MQTAEKKPLWELRRFLLQVISGMSLVGDGVAGRFRGKKWRSGPKNLGQKKALLSSRRAASLLYTLNKRWCKCCGAEWYGVGRARLNKPIPTRPPLLPELARAKDINQGGVVEHSAGELGGCKHWDHPVTVYTSPLIPPTHPPSRPFTFRLRCVTWLQPGLGHLGETLCGGKSRPQPRHRQTL